MAGKFSIYVKDNKLKSDMEAIARFDRVSITHLIGGILKNYAETRADDIAVIRRQDAEINELKAHPVSKYPKPCPRCGETPVMKRSTTSGHYFARCKCGILITDWSKLSDAVEQWNQRK